MKFRRLSDICEGSECERGVLTRGSGCEGRFNHENGESLGGQGFSKGVSTRKHEKEGHKEVNLKQEIDGQMKVFGYVVLISVVKFWC